MARQHTARTHPLKRPLRGACPSLSLFRGCVRAVCCPTEPNLTNWMYLVMLDATE